MNSSKLKCIFLCAFAGLILGCHPSGFSVQNDWKTATPESQGISSAELGEALEDLIIDPRTQFHSVLIIRNGKIITEYYAPGYNQDTLHNLHSATKSVTGTLIGIAERKKRLNREDRVIGFFDDWEIESENPWKQEMTIEDLLTMRSGLNWAENDTNALSESDFYSMCSEENWLKYILDKEVLSSPGTYFYYSSGDSHLLMGVLAGALNQPVQRFAERTLFFPLGIRRYHWSRDPQGHPIGGWGLHLTARDFAKIGQLYVNDGKWNGRRILSKSWVATAEVNHIEDPDIGYGYQLRTAQNVCFSMGFGGQSFAYALNSDLLFVYLGDSQEILGTQEALEDFWPRFSAALKSTDSIEENETAYDEYLSLLEELSHFEFIKQEPSENILGLENKPILFGYNSPVYIKSFTRNQDLKNRFISKIVIDDIREDEMDLTITYLNPENGNPAEVSYTFGLNNQYRIQSCSELNLIMLFRLEELSSHYPEPEDYKYRLRAFFPDENTIKLECHVLGSTIPAVWTINIKGEDFELEIEQQPGHYVYVINGRIE